MPVATPTVPEHRFHTMLLDAIRHEHDWRERAERNFRYYDGDQWTDAEIKTLQERGQQATVINICRPQVDSLHSIYLQRKTDLKVLGREISDDQDAQVATHLLKQVMDQSGFEFGESQWFRSGCIPGIGWLEICLEPDEMDDSANPEENIYVRHVHFEDIFFDPYARSMDGSDFKWVCRRVWMSTERLKELYPTKSEDVSRVSTTLGDAFNGAERFAQATTADTAAVKYYDGENQRIAVYEMWYKDASRKVHRVVFAYDVFLEGGDDDSMNDDPLECNIIPFVPFIAARSRQGLPLGIIDFTYPLQDSLNKLYSKWQWNMMTRQMIIEDGAADDIDFVRRELAKPDGIIALEVGGLGKIEIPDNINESQHLSNMMLMISQFSQRVSGINDALLGVGGVNARSAEQEASRQIQGAAMQSAILDNMFCSKKRLGRIVLKMIAKHYTMRKVARTVAPNGESQYYQINEAYVDSAGREVKREIKDIMRYDLVIEVAPQFDTVRQNQLQNIAEVAKTGVIPAPIASEIIVQLADLPDKQALLEKMQQYFSQQEALLAQQGTVQ